MAVPTQEEIFQALLPKMVDQFSVGEDQVTLDADVRNDLNADSLDVVEFVMQVEDAYPVRPADADVAACVTVGDFVALIHQRMVEKEAGNEPAEFVVPSRHAA